MNHQGRYIKNCYCIVLYLEKQKDLYTCFTDYEKAFDRVNHEKLIEKLKLAGLNGKDVRIIAGLYWEQAAAGKL